MSERPDIDRLADTVREGFTRVVPGADGHPVISVGGDAEPSEAALSDLAARARRSYPESWNEEIREVEDDRDRLREELSNAEFMRDGYFQSVDRLARRVAELEAALREIEAATNSSAVQRIARAALYGDGGGA